MMETSSLDRPPSDLNAILSAFQTFVNAPLEEKRALLECDQHLLLTDTADYLASLMIDEVKKSDDPEQQRLANYIEALRNMLRRCRKFGIPAVWQEFEARSKVRKPLPGDADPEAVMLAFQAMLQVSFHQKRMILEREQQHLLTDTAEQLLTSMIEEAEQHGTTEALDAIKYWKTLRSLLRRARKIGLAAAWEEFEARERVIERVEQEADFDAVQDAILKLASARPENLRAMLERERHLLLVDGVEQLINLLIQQANDENPDFATRLEGVRSIIFLARSVGIEAAFKEMQDASKFLAGNPDGAHFLAVSPVIRQFVFADRLEEMRVVLEKYSALLLTDAAEYILNKHIQYAGKETDSRLLERLQRRLQLLRDLRQADVNSILSLIETANRYYTPDQQAALSAINSDLLETFQVWGSIRVYREQRRFLETRPALLDMPFDTLLEAVVERDRIREEELRQNGEGISEDEARATQMVRDNIALLRDIRVRVHAHSDTVRAIREAYVNAHTGFALDLPLWLEEVEDRYQTLVKRDEPLDPSAETAQMLVDLLHPALLRARNDPRVAPETLAELYKRLGTALSGLDSVHQAENLEEAILYLEEALKVYTRERYLQSWANVQFNLAAAYFHRVRHDRQDNLEHSRIACERALQVLTHDTNPSDWVKLQQNLGLIYLERTLGRRGENHEQAIEYLKVSLEVFTRETYPVDWARSHINLGSAYHKRDWGDKKENATLAITHYEAALQVYTKRHFSREWFEIQRGLHNIYREIDPEKRAETLESAIALEEEFLEVYTRESYPLQWANAQNSLGTLYADRMVGDLDENLQQAFKFFEAALRVRTREAFPMEFQHTMLNMAQFAYWKLVNRAQERGDAEAVRNTYARAHQYYTAAREVQAELGWMTASAQERAALQGEAHATREMYARDAWCLWQVGDLRGAVVALEAGRAQALAESQATANTQLEGVCPAHADDFTRAREQLRDATASREREKIRSARDPFLQVRQAIRSHCQPHFLPDEPTYQEIALAASPEQALIYLVATDRGGVTFVVPAAQGQPDAENREPIAILLPRLTWETSIEWLERVDSEKGKLGGFRFGLEFRGIKLIAHWLSRARDNQEEARWLTAPLCDLPQVIPASMPTLRAAVDRMLATWRAEADRLATGDTPNKIKAQEFRARLTTPLDQTAPMINILTRDLGWFVLQVELEHVLQQMRETFVEELRMQLDQHGLSSPDQPVALIPCGRLGVLPIHAAGARKDPQTGEPIPFLETCEFTYQASARSLAAARATFATLPTNGPVITVGNPQPSKAPELKWAEFEAMDIADFARRQGRRGSKALIGLEAKYKRVREMLKTLGQQHSGAWIHIASHGYADPGEPANCYMLLGNDKRLSLADLQRERLLQGLRGFNASGCLTGLGDIMTAPDELGSFAVGILQAGAPCAIATLWSVNDHANYLLMWYCMREILRVPAFSPARALGEAVRWMRKATRQDLNTLEKISVRSFPLEGDLTRAAIRGAHPQDEESLIGDNAPTANGAPPALLQVDQTTTPYSHPIYWASAVVYGA